MSEILTEKWFWIVVLLLSIVIVGALLLVYLIVLLPFPFNTILTILLVVGWGIAAGYKEWIMSKSKEKKERKGSY